MQLNANMDAVILMGNAEDIVIAKMVIKKCKLLFQLLLGLLYS